MQNKPNSPKAQMSVSRVSTMDYEKKTLGESGKNKPNSNPIQSQTNPISEMPKMNVNKVLTKDYENKWLWRLRKNKPNTNPNKAKFTYPKRGRIRHNYLPSALFPLTSSTTRDYNEIFSQISFFQRTPIERIWK